MSREAFDKWWADNGWSNFESQKTTAYRVWQARDNELEACKRERDSSEVWLRLIAERDRLRAAIDSYKAHIGDAPHSRNCNVVIGPYRTVADLTKNECNCWKSQALAEVKP